MTILHRRSPSWTPGAFAKQLWIMIGLALFTAPATTFAQNPDCTLIVPSNPFTAVGLATPYRLVATNPVNGPCTETSGLHAGDNPNSSAFVQAGILDLATGQISIYNPLVIDGGTLPAAPPVVPNLPLFSVVALWFGSGGNNLTLAGAAPGVLSDSDCHQGMGQFAYCNASAFFAVADFEMLIGALNVPPLGFGSDGQVCPSVRSFAVVDQDQSDNLPTTYLVTASGLLAQDTAANRARFPGWARLKNASDNRLTDLFLDPALGCTPWTAPDLADPGTKVPALPLNELQAFIDQPGPVAQIPLGDPFVLNPANTGHPDLAKVNEYRAGVGQFPAFSAQDASTTTYCANLSAIAPQKLLLDRPYFIGRLPPFLNVADSLFTFMGQRFVSTYEQLKCQDLTGLPSQVTVHKNAATKVFDNVCFNGAPCPAP